MKWQSASNSALCIVYILMLFLPRDSFAYSYFHFDYSLVISLLNIFIIQMSRVCTLHFNMLAMLKQMRILFRKCAVNTAASKENTQCRNSLNEKDASLLNLDYLG